jgi:hypothetical protein
MSHQTENKRIFCPECNHSLNPELVSYLLGGQSVYCEVCGFCYTGISTDGEVKPLEKPEGQDVEQNLELNKKEIQWIQWKKQWNIIKKTVRTEWDQYKERKITTKTALTPHEETVFSPSENSKLKSAIRILTQLTPVYYVLIGFITLINFVEGGTHPLYFAGSVLIDCIVIVYDLKIIIPQVKQKRIPHVGLPMIIIGGLSTQAFGVGLILLTRGILHLLDFIRDTIVLQPNHPALRGDNYSSTLWYREVIISFISVFKLVVIMLLLSGILFNILTLAQSGRNGFDIFKLVWRILFGLIALGFNELYILPQLKKFPIEDIPERIAVVLIILGIISAGNSISVPFLIIGILLVIFRKMSRKLTRSLPSSKDIGDLQILLIATATKNSSFPPFQSNLPAIPRFDPITGNPLNNVDFTRDFPASEVSIRKSSNQKPAKKDSPSTLKKEEILPNSVSEEIYTILEPIVRKKLVDLPISSEERDKIAKSLLYLNSYQQLQYMDEIESINQNPELIHQEFINRIQQLPIDPSQQKFLKDQLEYLPFETQEEYILFLEDTVK